MHSVSRRNDALPIAERATFEAFANCYVREVDPGRDAAPGSGDGHCGDWIEWRLDDGRVRLRAEVLTRSLCGPHRFGRLRRRVRRRDGEGEEWIAVAPLDAVGDLLREAHRRSAGRQDAVIVRRPADRAREIELLLRVLLSCQAIAATLEAPASRSGTAVGFIEAERSLVFGHAFHPTPKSMQGVSEWQRVVYGPESGQRFRLVGFAAAAALVEERTAGTRPATALMARIAGPDLASARLGERERLLLLHPLQAEALLLTPQIAALRAAGELRLLGPMGPPFAATSSMRTVYSEASPFMLKFSLPVRITNSLRASRRGELDAGVTLARFFRRTRVLARHPRLRILLDSAYATLALPGRRESGFETILRQNPFRGRRSPCAVTVAALTAEPADGGRSLLRTLVEMEAAAAGEPPIVAARRWFARYLECAFVSLVHLYDETGIALEAHQQNSLVALHGARPVGAWYRDNQGYYLAGSYRGTLEPTIPEATAVPDLYFPEEEIAERFAYYLVVNQVFGVIARFGRDGLADEAALLASLRRRIEALAGETQGAGRRFCRLLLDRPTITLKANLGARMRGVDELADGADALLYTRWRNPLFEHAPAGAGEAGHAFAL